MAHQVDNQKEDEMGSRFLGICTYTTYYMCERLRVQDLGYVHLDAYGGFRVSDSLAGVCSAKHELDVR